MPKKKPMLIHSIDEYGIITGDPDEGPVSPLQKSLRKGLTGFELGLDLARQRKEQDQYNALRESLLQRNPNLTDAIDRLMPAETLHPSLQKIEDSLSHLPKKRPLMDILKENAEVLYQVDKRQRARANQAQTPATTSQATRPPATNSLYQEASYEPDLFGGSGTLNGGSGFDRMAGSESGDVLTNTGQELGPDLVRMHPRKRARYEQQQRARAAALQNAQG
ncbi:MAG: hypothetical protein ACPGOY_18895, partial [Rhodospirillaceae bacterium]